MKKQLINFFHGRFGNKVLKAKYRDGGCVSGTE